MDTIFCLAAASINVGMFESVLFNFLSWIAMFIVVPAGTAMLLSKLGNFTQGMLVYNFGNRSQAWLGMPGVVVHEASHMLAAKVFGHKLSHVSLFNLGTLFHDEATLGYVEHSYSRFSIYEMIGNLALGIAPVYGCTAVIGIAHKLLLHQPILMFESLPTGLNMTSLARFWKFTAFWSASAPVWERILFGVITFMIVDLGYGLSDADWGNVIVGSKDYCKVIAILSLVLAVVMKFSTVVQAGLLHVAHLAICFQLLWCLQGAAYLLATIVLLAIIQVIHRYII